MNLLEFQKNIQKRWGSKENITCPKCNNSKTYLFKDKKTFKCTKCLKKFSVRVGTIFENSNLPLLKWFFAVYLFTSLKKGISSVQLSKYLGCTQKTTWFVLSRIRVSMENPNKSLLEGISEIDEVFIGCRACM